MKFIFNWIDPLPPRPCRRAVACLAALASIFVGGGTGAAGATADVERAELVMGTVARVALPADAARPERFDAAFAAFRAVDAAMSLYRPDDELVRVNARAAARPEPVSEALFTVLARAREISDESDGAFDVTVLPLLRLWGAYPELPYLGAGSVTAVGYEGLRLDPAARTVSFARPGMGIDLGGIAKGFALARARAALVAVGVTRARLDLGGDLAFVGGDAGGWRVAVRDPERPDDALGVLTVDADTSVSTSGNYERDFRREGWRASSHVYDPRTGRPVAPDLAVTVWSADATDADALSTAFLVLGPEHAAALAAREPGVGVMFSAGRGAARRLTFVGRPPRGWAGEDASLAVARAEEERDR